MAYMKPQVGRNPEQDRVQNQYANSGNPLYRDAQYGGVNIGKVNSVTGNPMSLDAKDAETRQMTNNVVDYRVGQRQAKTPIGGNYSQGLGTGVAPVNVAANNVQNAQHQQEMTDLANTNRSQMQGYQQAARNAGQDPNDLVVNRTGMSKYANDTPEAQQARAMDYSQRLADQRQLQQETRQRRIRAAQGLGNSPEEQMMFAMQRAMQVNPVDAMAAFGQGSRELGANATELGVAGLRSNVEQQRNKIEEMRVQGMISDAQANQALNLIREGRAAAGDVHTQKRNELDIAGRRISALQQIQKQNPNTIANETYNSVIAGGGSHAAAVDAAKRAEAQALPAWNALLQMPEVKELYGNSFPQGQVPQGQTPGQPQGQSPQGQAPGSPSPGWNPPQPANPLADPRGIRDIQEVGADEALKLFRDMRGTGGRNPTKEEFERALKERGIQISRRGQDEILNRGTFMAPNESFFEWMVPGLSPENKEEFMDFNDIQGMLHGKRPDTNRIYRTPYEWWTGKPSKSSGAVDPSYFMGVNPTPYNPQSVAEMIQQMGVLK